MRGTLTLVASSLVLGALLLAANVSHVSQVSAQQTAKKVDMGDYEPVVPWPKPLPVRLKLPRAKKGWFSQLVASAYRRMFTRSEKRIFFVTERLNVYPKFPL